MTSDRLVKFITESNAIEGIHREPTKEEIQAHEAFLELDQVTVGDLENLVSIIAGARLRDRYGLDVYVGNHVPPPGAPEIRFNLETLLEQVNTDALPPWELHISYETLHPFTDGNGRSGRALWAWQMVNYHYRFSIDLGFLHAFYYQTLDSIR